MNVVDAEVTEKAVVNYLYEEEEPELIGPNVRTCAMSGKKLREAHQNGMLAPDFFRHCDMMVNTMCPSLCKLARKELKEDDGAVEFKRLCERKNRCQK